MTTQPHEFQPREVDGKFGVKRLREVPPLTLCETDAVDRRAAKGSEIAVELIARRIHGGGFTEVLRDEEAEEQLREVFDALDEDSFAAHSRDVLAAAEKVSVMERAMEDPWDTEAYQELMDEAAMEPVRVPAWERAPDDAAEDWETTCASVLEHHDDVFRAAVERLAEADRAARG